ncbi:mitochondrial ubiquitin ligase activator of nfkb 1-A isoform 2-T2 [Fundulus diaphanus]
MGDSSLNPVVWLGVGSSFAFSGLFYHLYREKKKELIKLKEIPIFQPDEHLLKVLNASPHKRLQYVAVEGVVHADGEPLTSKFVPRCQGVIQKVVQLEHWKYWNNITRTWNSRTTNQKESSNTVPFSLVQPGSYISQVYVKVQDPLEASGCYMEVVHSKARRAQESLVDVVVQGLRGEKPMAMVECEEMLRVGSSLTGFGEVVLEGGQVVRLQAPQDGRSYVLVPSDYRSFMARHEASATMWMALTAVTGLTGASLLACIVSNLLGKRDDRSR